MVPLHRDDGDSAAAAGNDHHARVGQSPDGGQLHNGHGLWGGHHLTPATAGVLCHVPALFTGHFFGLFLCHKRADGLGGGLERRIVSVYHHLRQHRGHALLKPPVQKLFFQGVLQIVADIALTHGHAHGKRHHIGGRLLLAVGGKGVLDHPHLRAVAVGNDHLMSGFDQIRDGLGGLLHGLHLLRQIFSKGVAAQSNDNAFTHIVLPHF